MRVSCQQGHAWLDSSGMLGSQAQWEGSERRARLLFPVEMPGPCERPKVADTNSSLQNSFTWMAHTARLAFRWCHTFRTQHAVIAYASTTSPFKTGV
eukprot:4952081-Pleurochrysis_carterae.AAC.1